MLPVAVLSDGNPYANDSTMRFSPDTINWCKSPCFPSPSSCKLLLIVCPATAHNLAPEPSTAPAPNTDFSPAPDHAPASGPAPGPDDAPDDAPDPSPTQTPIPAPSPNLIQS